METSKHKQSALLRFFPLPNFLAMPAAGFDISDYSIKLISFETKGGATRVKHFGEKAIPPGTIMRGEILDPQRLLEVVKEMKDEFNIRYIRASLPEERGFVFETHVPTTNVAEMRSSIEFKLEENIPLSPSEAIFDFTPIPPGGSSWDGHDVVVSAFPRNDVETYVGVFRDAGLIPLSLEIESSAMARSIIHTGDDRTYMLVDFGRERAGISIVSNGVTRFATTIPVGGESISTIFRTVYSDMPADRITEMKNKHGILNTKENEAIRARVIEYIDELIETIKRYAGYWHTHGIHEGVANPLIERVYVCGGSANIAGLPEHINQAIAIPTVRANVWTNIFSIEEVIPPLSFQESLSYATAIGLAYNPQTLKA